MLPTVADVLDVPDLARCSPQVVAGHAYLQTPVRWVHAAEIADIAHLLRGGELVLTTGIALPADDAGLIRYVGELGDAGVAGLVVELGRRWTSLPQPVVEACEQGRLPLVVLRRESRFAAVIQAVGERIVDARLAELRAVEQVHDTFTELSLSGADGEQILRAAADLGGLPVVLESARHHVLGVEAAGQDVRELLADWDQRSRRVDVAGRTGYDADAGWLVTVVGGRDESWGRLVLVSPRPPGHRHVALAERTAATLALHRLLARDRSSLERQTHTALLRAVSERGASDPALPERCAAAGVPVQDRRLLGLVVLPRPGPEGPAGADAPQVVRDLAELVAGAVRGQGLDALVGIVDDTAAGVLLSLRRRTGEAAIVDRLGAAVHAAAGTRGMTVVIAAGTVADRLDTVRRTVVEARQVAEAALRAPKRRPVHRLADVHVRGLLHLLVDDERVVAFAERELAALRAHDVEHGSELVAMLRLLFAHAGNKAAAATTAHLSRPAYHDRLAKIERLLGLSLADFETLTSLHLALLISDERQAVTGG